MEIGTEEPLEYFFLYMNISPVGCCVHHTYLHTSIVRFVLGHLNVYFHDFLTGVKLTTASSWAEHLSSLYEINMCYVLSSIRHFNPTNNSINFPSTIIITHQIDDTWLTWHTLNSGQNIYFQHWMNLNINIYPQLMRHLQPGINC